MANAYDVTDKTEFMRYLDDNEQEVPELMDHAKKYQGTRGDRHNFGAWVRWKYVTDFNHAYTNWWLKNPSLFYKNQTT